MSKDRRQKCYALQSSSERGTSCKQWSVRPRLQRPREVSASTLKSDGQVTVVGAGAVGVCSALYLQREGFAVRLIDRGGIAGEASRSNAAYICADDCVPLGTPAMLKRIPGMLFDPLGPLAIRWSYLPKLLPWLYQLLKASSSERVEEISVALTTLLDLAVDAYTPLLEASDATDQVTNSGLLYVYGSDAGFESDGFGRELRRRRSVKFEVLDGHAIGELEPFLAGRCAQGIYCPGSAFTADPYRLFRTLADQFMRSGGEFVHAEVLGVEVVNDRLSNLLTTAGLYPVDRLVLAAGAWSRMLAKQLGADVPLDTERGYVMVLPNAVSRPRIPFLAVDHHVAVTPTTGGLRLAGTAEFAGLRARPNLKRADALLEGAAPFLGPVNATGAMRWMSFRPSMPDSLPVIGWAPRQGGAFFAFGHGHLGLSLAAITGKLVAEAMAGRALSVDLNPFRADRWTVGCAKSVD